MTDETDTHPIHLSRPALAKATAVSLLVAAVGLTLIVLPQSYGIDPTGLGEAMGLTPAPDLPEQLATPEEQLTIVLAPGQSVTRAHGLTEGQLVASSWSASGPLAFTVRGASGPAVQVGTLAATQTPVEDHQARLAIPADGSYKWRWENPGNTTVEATFTLRLAADLAATTTTETIEVPPRQGLEYKLEMVEDAWLAFAWQASASVTFDMHGEPHGADAAIFASYRVGTAEADAGNVTVAFAGTHGWYFQNDGREPVTITLEVTGPHTVVGRL